jgi:hypothetical protein
MNHALGFFDDDDKLFWCLENSANTRRALPSRKILMEKEHLSEILELAVKENGIEALNLEFHPGLSHAYKNGFLHAVLQDDNGLTLYSFPSNLHLR